jgi:tRNA dimethylallyltransferase
MSKPRVIAIAGPTASGKTALALQLASRLPVEIISVDSALVYRHMDIGTAKPTRQERNQVVHHLIDTLEPTQSYSAASFMRDAKQLIGEIQLRGRVPLLVGGTMLYFKALLCGIDDMPAASPEIREAINAEATAQGWPALHAQLAQVDPLTAQRLAPNDAQRIQRALEVYRATGMPLSHFFEQNKASARMESAQNAIDSVANMLFVSLEPDQRGWLHTRIAERFDAMLNAGLVQEVMQLRERGDVTADMPSMRCVGYRQTWEMLDGQFPIGDLPERGIAATRQLAKRQITWLRGMGAWDTLAPLEQLRLACDDPQAMRDAVALTESRL